MKTKMFLVILVLAGLTALAAPVKVKVTTNNAGIKVKPEIGAKTTIRLPLNTVLDAPEKQGEWYRVTGEFNGQKIAGFIHEMLVAVVGAAPDVPPVTVVTPTPPVKARDAVAEEISAQVEELRVQVKQKKDLAQALDALGPLLARTFQVPSQAAQKSLAADITLLKGLAQAGLKNEAEARREFKSVFEISPDFARNARRTITEPEVLALLLQAERVFRGQGAELVLTVTTDPAGAKLRVNGADAGPTPTNFKTLSPRVVLEIEKDGFRTVRDSLVFAQPAEARRYSLERLGTKLVVSSRPAGARIFLDGADTGRTTDGELPAIGPGRHQLRLVKEHHREWTAEVEVTEGAAVPPVTAELVGRDYASAGVWGGAKTGLLKEPVGIALAKDGRILIVETAGAPLRVFPPRGAAPSGGPETELKAEALKGPAGIALDTLGNIYITDVRKNAVLKLDPQGTLLAQWGKFRPFVESFSSPAGIACSAADHVFVVDAGNHRVKRYSVEGGLQKVWGKRGTRDGEFLEPRAVAVHPSGRVYVLDSRRVQIFTPDGEFVSAWGKAGPGDSEFGEPSAMAIDRAGCVYVADAGRHRVLKFDPEGVFVSAFGRPGGGPGELQAPVALAVDESGAVYVIERGNARLQFFAVGPGV